MRTIVCALLVGFALLVVPSGTYADTIYGITLINHQLIQIDSSTASSVLIGTVDGQVGSELGSFGGALYAFDQSNDVFRRIDPANASTLATTTSGINIFGEGGMSFRSDGMAFLSNSEGNSGNLFRCDVTVNNGCTLVAPLAISIDGLAFSSTGILYGLSQAPNGTIQPSLFTINPVTGVETLIGTTGVVGVNLAGLTFDSTGHLLAGIDSSLYSVNLGTGAATLIGNTGFSQYSGLAANVQSAPVPEPATLTLLLCGLVGLTTLRRKLTSS